jgi:hypothetical protein
MIKKKYIKYIYYGKVRVILLSTVRRVIFDYLGIFKIK